MAKPIIGIDLGTTNCAVTKFEKGKTTVLPIKGRMTTPSVLYIDGSSVKVGHEAKVRIPLSPEKCLSSTKRDMGTDTQYAIPGAPEPLTPVTAASLILKYLKQETEDYLGEVCNDVIITVPAYFGFAEREATRQAAIAAGWNPLELIEEPTAAALIYGQNRGKNSLITVVDLGGGTFDVTVLQYTIDANNCPRFTPINTGGDHHLGGDDFDNAVVQYMKEQGISGSDAVLKVEAEKAKIELSEQDAVDISVDGGDIVLTRDKYRELIAPYLAQIGNTIVSTVQGAGKSLDDIDRFILVGGSCKHPVVKEAVEKIVGRKPYASNNLDTAVSEGAALYHHMIKQLGGDGGRVDHIAPKALGTDVVFNNESLNVVLIKKNAPIPTRVAQLAYFRGSTLYTKVIEGDQREATAQNTIYTMEVPMRHANTPHAIVTIFEMDNSGLLNFITHELSPAVDITPLAEAAEKANNQGAFDYAVWEKFKATLSAEHITTKEHKMSVRE